MGDANGSQVVMEVEDIEALFDEALEEVDDGIYHLFYFMNNLNERTAYVLREIASYMKFRRCFTALNLLVFPIVLAIVLSYGIVTLTDYDSDFANALEVIIMMLMYLSGCIGLPFYIFALYDTYLSGHTIPNESRFPRRVPTASSEMTNNKPRNASYRGNDNSRDWDILQNSQKGFSILERTLHKKLLERIRSDMSRTTEQSGEVQEINKWLSKTSKEIEEPEVLNEEESRSTDQSEVDLSSDVFAAETTFHKTSKKESAEFYGVQVIILNNSSELSVDVEKNEKLVDVTNDEDLLTNQVNLHQVEGDSHASANKFFTETAFFPEFNSIGDSK